MGYANALGPVAGDSGQGLPLGEPADIAAKTAAEASYLGAVAEVGALGTHLSKAAAFRFTNVNLQGAKVSRSQLEVN